MGGGGEVRLQLKASGNILQDLTYVIQELCPGLVTSGMPPYGAPASQQG